MQRTGAILAVLVTMAACSAGPPSPAFSPPDSLSDLQRRLREVLQQAAVPGAGVALIRHDGVEWQDGIGVADRARQLPVTADTHFRVGEISQTFVALAAIQLAEDGYFDLDAPLSEVAPDIVVDNPFHATDPVRIIHLLQHTAGFDDDARAEQSVAVNARERSLEETVARFPQSRGVRWPPGTRMSSSRPGYGVAGLLVERISRLPYEDYIEQEILRPLQMSSSSFRVTGADEALFAQAYVEGTETPVGYPPITWTPAGNLHTSAREMARFVQMLLRWGELDDAFIVDPEYLGSMEQPQTTIAARAGLRTGYGSGVDTRVDLPYKVLGHEGFVDGFSSAYGYSAARDVGYVVLLNMSGPRASRALREMTALCLTYLKRDVDPGAQPAAVVTAASLDKHAGYYDDLDRRLRSGWEIQSWLRGRTIRRVGSTLVEDPVFGSARVLVPVSETTFRTEQEVDASRIFTIDKTGRQVLAGGDFYAERTPRWRVEIVRVPLLSALTLLVCAPLLSIVWLRHRRRRGRTPSHP